MQASTQQAGLCSICQCQIAPQEQSASCPTCKTAYHLDCWRENGGCAIYGCPSVPQTEHRESIEIPASYWGQENKTCPSCRQVILAAALRCRNCGTVFSTARPETARDFRNRTGRQDRAPGIKRTIVALFVFSALPCSAPIAAVVGFVWYSNNREALRSLPGLFQGLCKIALGLGVTQTILTVVLLLAYTAFRSP
ncbi:MAG TPA: RING finger protein [Blastocatellia bacterium]|nr:RING finger protein [Blastocatellia bacterium]